MNLIRIHDVTMRYEERLVLREAFFRLETGDRVGLIGDNGTGKTTLLKLVLGQAEPTEGKVEVMGTGRIGYFSQFSELDGEMSVQNVLEEVFADVRATEAELERISAQLGEMPTEGDEWDRTLARQAELLEEMEHRDGWNYPTKIDTVLGKLGFDETHRHLPVDQLSGGWRNRAALARILLEEPEILLLDEPTNYLDIEGVAWLEEWLKQIRGAFLLVSHDRHFLDRVVNRIVEIENHHLHEYAGGYTDYVREKQFRIKTLQRQFEHEEELLVYEAEAIKDRSEAAKNPSERLSRQLADIKKRTAPRPMELIVTDLYRLLHVRTSLLHAENLGKSYGDRRLFDGVTVDLHQGDRLAIVGPNGCGKTTLLRTLTGAESPDTGRVSWEGGIEYIHFNRVLESLSPKDTVSHAVNVMEMVKDYPRKQVHKFLSLLRFAELDMRQRIGTLSGGQKARVALAQCLLSGAAVLVLDEPTNHLDMTSIQVMERALIHFPGAVIVVSHDRFFIDKIATRLIVFDSDGVREVNGNWTQWQARQEGRA